jgi:nitroreductase
MAETSGDGMPDGLAAVGLQVMGADTLSARMAASLFEVGVTVSTWPQLASEVVLGGASITAAVRRIGLGMPLPSGRRVLDLDDAITRLAPESLAPSGAGAVVSQLPRDPQVVATNRAFPPLVQHVVAHAVLAPSGGNSQPWRFVWEDDHLDVVHDPGRSRTWLDHSGGAARLALGAAIENAVIAAAERDHATDVVLEPDPADPTVVARLRFQPSDDPVVERMAAWLPAVAARRTDRRLGMREELTADDGISLSDAAAVHGCMLQVRTDPGELFELGGLLGVGDRVRMLNPVLHHDMIGELRWDDEEARATADGLTLSSLGLPPGMDAGLRLLARPDVAEVLRRLDIGHRLELGAVARAATASALCLLTTRDPSPLGWLRGGRAMQRVWLAATRRGLAVQPMTAILHMLELVDAGVDILDTSEVEALQQLRKRMYRVFDVPSGAALMLLRVARLPGEAEMSLRRPVETVTSLGRGGTS